MNAALMPLFARLLEQHPGLIVDRAKVHQVGVRRLDGREDRVEVRLLFGALEAEHLDAVLLGCLAKNSAMLWP